MGVINPYPPPRTGARKAISLSFPCGGEGGNEDYSPSVCNSCCCCCFAPREMTNNCHSKRACVTAAAQLEQAALYHHSYSHVLHGTTSMKLIFSALFHDAGHTGGFQYAVIIYSPRDLPSTSKP